MNALSHIQTAKAAGAASSVLSTQNQGAGTSVFREAMHHAMEPEKLSKKSPAKESEQAAAPLRTHYVSPQSSPGVTGDATPDDKEPISSSAADGQGLDGSAGLGVDGSADENMQGPSTYTVTNGFASAQPDGETSSDSTTGSDLRSMDPSGGAVSKDKRTDATDEEKNSGQPQPSAQIPAASATVAIALPPTVPAGDTSVKSPVPANGSGTASFAAAGENPRGTFRTFPAGDLPKGDPPKQGGIVVAKPGFPTISENASPLAAVHAPTHAAANSSKIALPNVTATADVPTEISSSDLLLTSIGGTDQPSTAATDLSVQSISSGVVSDGNETAAIGAAENTVSKIADAPANSQAPGTIADVAATAVSHAGLPGHAAPINPVSTLPLTSGLAAPAMGNIPGGHMGTSAAMPIGRAADRTAPPSVTPSATFSAMDRAGSGPGGSLLHASPNQVSVGVADPHLGWIEVRAERVGGQVTAALTVNSITSHTELTSALPAISSYLNDHHQAVQHIHVEPGQAAWQTAAGSQEQSSGGRQRRNNAQPVETISGSSEGGISAAVSIVQRANHGAEAAPQRSKVEGHQFSVRA